MQYFANLILVLAAFHTGYAANTEYVTPNSIQCINTGVNFNLSENPALSDLYKETNLQVTLFTGRNHKQVADADFDKATGRVTLSFNTYQFDAVTAFGPNGRPLLYNIEQQFYAIPLPASPTHGRNYTFGVFCTVPAAFHVNVTTNTTDDGHGGHGGDVVNPRDHVTAVITGLHADNSTTLGDSLTYSIFLNDKVYAALLPVNCKYYNPNNEIQNVPFVSDSCPRIFPPDPESYFFTMVKHDDTRYDIKFRAFSFETATYSMLGIDCDIMLCITQNAANCSMPCFGGAPPTTGTGTTASPPTTITVSTTSGTTGTTTAGTTVSTTPGTTESTTSGTTETTTAGTTESTTSGSTAPTTSASTTEPTTSASTTEPTTSASTTEPTTSASTTEPTTSASTTEPTTSASTTEPTTSASTTEPTTSASTTEPTTSASTTEPTTTPTTTTPPVPEERRKRSIDESEFVGASDDPTEPTSTTFNDRNVFAVRLPGSEPPCTPISTCDTGMMNALYGIVGGLAALVAILVLTLLYLMHIGRRHKIEHNHAPIFATPNGYTA